MKKLMTLISLLCVTTVYASPCDNGAPKGSECEVIRVLTRCDVEKQALRRKIVLLEKRAKELLAENEKLRGMRAHDLAVYRSVVSKSYSRNTIHEVEEKQVVKHSIISLYTVRDVTNVGTSTSGGVATATVQTNFQPGIKYQYQFSFGLVPEIGIDIKGNPLFGLGFEF
jgi:hypothetical protein